MGFSTRTAQVLAWTIGIAVTIARIAAAFRLPLTGDEAYYWEWSKRPAFGYADHPPGVAWTIAAGSWIGSHPGWLRLGFVVCGVVATLTLAACATRLADGDARAGAVAAIAFSLAPLTSVAFTIATPDGPYLLFWCLALLCAANAFAGGRNVWWGALGLAMGGALLSRMLAFALVFGIALIAAGRWKVPGVRAGVAIAFTVAAIVFAPFVFWNAAHEWQTFAFTFIHRQDESAGAFSPLRLLTLYLTQLAAYSPGIWLAVTALAVRPQNRLLAATALPLLAVLALLAIVRPVEGYWALGPFASLCAMLGVASLHVAPGARSAWTLACVLPATLSLAIVFSAALAPGPMYAAIAQRFNLHLRNSGPFEIFTFAPLARDVKAIATGPQTVVMTDGYGFSSVLDFEAGITPVVVGYDWQGRESKRWYSSTMQPARALFVDKEPLAERPDIAARLAKACGHVRDAGTLSYGFAKAPPRRYYLTWCEGLAPGALATLRWEAPA